MSQATTVDQLTAAAITSAGLPAWLEARKLADLETFLALPHPDSATMEDWRRTDVSRIDLHGYDVAAGADSAPDQRLSAGWERAGEGGALLLQQGSNSLAVRVPEALQRQGVVVSTLEDAARTHAELVKRYLDHEVVPAASGKFAALNAAFWRGGAFVHVPRGVQAELPVWSAVAPAAHDGGNHAVLPRTLVVVGEGASLVFTDEYAGLGTGNALSSAVTEVVLEDGASIKYLVLQQWGEGVDHVATHRVHLGKGCNAELVVAAVGGRLSKVYMEVALLGEGSSARISGLVIGDGTQHFDYQSLQDHHAPNCTSDLLVKGALRDSAVSVYSGLIKIRKQAQHSDAYQANRNLLLSSTAKADSIPKLEIEANDVRCTHGATVGQVDADQLFYLQSRGFSIEDAQNTLVHGFFQPVIDRIALPNVRDQIHAAIDGALAGLDPAAAAVAGGAGTATDEGAIKAMKAGA